MHCKIFRILPHTLLCACILLVSIIQTAYAAHTHQIIVKYKSLKTAGAEPTEQQLRALQSTSQKNLRFVRKASGDTQVYALDEALPLAEVRDIAEQLSMRDDIEYAEPNARRFPQFVPSDTSYLSQWYLFEAAGGINAQSGWDITRGNSATVTAVIDTGILSHSDISRVMPGYDFISSSAFSNDGDGRDNNPLDNGDFLAINECGPGEPSMATNSSWHGTIITGIIAATTNDTTLGNSIAGIDHNGFVLPVRVLGKCGGFVSDIADAIRWAAGLSVPGVPNNTSPADVINLSFGATDSCSGTEQSAIDAAVATGAVVVVAAGNEASAVTSSSPANCGNVISVLASTRQGGETQYTNFGPEVTIAAPGGNDSGGANGILSTGNSGSTTPSTENFVFAVGTSFAAPMVSGAAALLKGLKPSLTANNIEALLRASARAFPTGASDAPRDCIPRNCGSGLLDINAALQLAQITGTDSTPDSFTFNSAVDVGISSSITSDLITITGSDIPSIVNISDGEYSINDGPFTNLTGTINSGETIRVRLNSSASFGTTTSLALSIDAVNATFTATTMANPNSTNNSGGGSSGGGAILWLPLILLIYLPLSKLKKRSKDSNTP